jgi:ParB family chromosome partitioning protein
VPEVNDSPQPLTPETPEVSPPAEPSPEASEAGPETAPPPPPEPSPQPQHTELRGLHPAPAHIALDRIDDDDTFRSRPEGDVAALAMDIARLGQLFPVDLSLKPPDRFQVITGFRRVAALKFLHREKVLARLHVDLNDDDATLLALAEAIHGKSVERDELHAMRERLEARGRLSAAARDMLDKALALDDGLAPEDAPEEEEVDADELASDVTQRLGQINQDLSLLADVFADLDEARRQTLLEQLKYSVQLVEFLEGGS